ncbi:MAG: hypothetical protein MZV70_29530 [Desulfobacterales bacterium]|nr:hypothetical protein [Desulfobacterales bacterium]
MNARRDPFPLPIALAAALALSLAACGEDASTRALEAIKAEDMAFHLKFLSAPEFRGRPTPSVEQDIASKYIALTAERIGLQAVHAGRLLLSGGPGRGHLGRRRPPPACA